MAYIPENSTIRVSTPRATPLPPPSNVLQVVVPQPQPTANPMTQGVNIGAVPGDRSQEVAHPRLGLSQTPSEILQKTLSDLNKNRPPPEHTFLVQVHQKLESFFHGKLTKAMNGELTESDHDVVGDSKDLFELCLGLSRAADTHDAEMDKMAVQSGIEVGKLKADFWHHVSLQELNILESVSTLQRANEVHRVKLTTSLEKSKLEREAQEFRQKIEILCVTAEENRKEYEYLQKLQHPMRGIEPSPPSVLKPPTTTFLHRLARSGDPLLKKFLEAHVSTENLDPEGNTPFACAVAAGKLEAAQQLINIKTVKTFKNNKGETLLHLAAQSKNLEMVRWVYSLNPNSIHARDKQNRTPIFCGVIFEDLESVRFFKKEGANLEARDSQQQTILVHALHCDDRQIAGWLLDAAPTLITKNDSCEGGPVALAVTKGDLALAKEMVERGGTLDPAKRSTPKLLHEAAKTGRCDLIQWLIALKFPIDEEDKDGCTPLLIAVLEGNVEAVKCLINNGARTTHPFPGTIGVNKKRIQACTLTHVAIFSKHPVEILETIPKADNSLATNELGHRPLESAVFHGFVPVAKCLCREDESPETLQSLLPLAIQSGSLPMVKWVYGLIPRTESAL
ncbi:MAG: ankyrin repeat domain-containing protein, partial [Parachlamydia sp.]|nr:ankyrin repeat domain-containing protein [Parachlamydia sp.]